jgi:DNA replication and repair protein RecF
LQWGASNFSVNGQFRTREADHDRRTLSLSYSQEAETGRNRKKLAKLDGELVEKLSELRHHLITLPFTPDDLNVLKGGPSERRDFLDSLLSILDDGYLESLKEYETIRDQRNSLLKQPSPDGLLLDQYDEVLVRHGEYLIRQRSELVPELQQEFQDLAGNLLEHDSEKIELKYTPDCSETEYAETLSSSRGNDREKGYTTRGPHRDDWTVKIDDRPVDRFASQGELRTLLLTLKISSNSVIIDRLSRQPILLLDDLESELDSTRKHRVLSLLDQSPSQVIITGTGGLDTSSLGESSDCIFTLEAG